MNRIKTLLIVSLVIALSFSMIGCSLLPSGSSADVETGNLEAVPQWLTLAHRAEAAEQPEIDEEEEEADEEEAAEAPVATQPATTQPVAEQPASTAPAQTSGTPKYMQPGTMEYIAKLQLDRAAEDYKRFQIQSVDPDRSKEEKDTIKAQMRGLLATMNAIANEIGLDLKSTYGITPPAASGSTDWSHTFDKMESPSGWGD